MIIVWDIVTQKYEIKPKPQNYALLIWGYRTNLYYANICVVIGVSNSTETGLTVLSTQTHN